MANGITFPQPISPLGGLNRGLQAGLGIGQRQQGLNLQAQQLRFNQQHQQDLLGLAQQKFVASQQAAQKKREFEVAKLQAGVHLQQSEDALTKEGKTASLNKAINLINPWSSTKAVSLSPDMDDKILKEAFAAVKDITKLNAKMADPNTKPQQQQIWQEELDIKWDSIAKLSKSGVAQLKAVQDIITPSKPSTAVEAAKIRAAATTSAATTRAESPRVVGKSLVAANGEVLFTDPSSTDKTSKEERMFKSLLGKTAEQRKAQFRNNYRKANPEAKEKDIIAFGNSYENDFAIANDLVEATPEEKEESKVVLRLMPKFLQRMFGIPDAETIAIESIEKLINAPRTTPPPETQPKRTREAVREDYRAGKITEAQAEKEIKELESK